MAGMPRTAFMIYGAVKRPCLPAHPTAGNDTEARSFKRNACRFLDLKSLFEISLHAAVKCFLRKKSVSNKKKIQKGGSVTRTLHLILAELNN
jgi:hypothetical protein